MLDERVKEVHGAIEATRRYWELVTYASVGMLFDHYTQSYSGLLNKFSIEMDLLKRVRAAHEVGKDLPTYRRLWPSALSRTSGALLQWVLCQTHRVDSQVRLPGILATRPPLNSEQAESFAWAWFQWPITAAVGGETDQLAIVQWLMVWASANGWSAGALAEAKNWRLAERVARRWTLTTFRTGGAQQWLRPILIDSEPEIRRLGLDALGSIMIANQDASLAGLCRLCFGLALEYEFERDDLESAESLYTHALQATELLHNSKEVTGNDLLAIRIACLAHLSEQAASNSNHNDRASAYQKAAIHAYRQHWLPTTQPYPFPHKLLPILQESHNAFQTPHDLRHVLLDNMLTPNNVPSWVQTWLEAERADRQHDVNSAITAWESLFAMADQGGSRVLRQYWLYFLERLTLTHLSLTGSLEAATRREQLTKAWRWVQSRTELPDELRDRGTAGLMLLLPVGSSGLIQAYREFHSRFDLHPLTALAATRYMRALLLQRSSRQLRALLLPARPEAMPQAYSLRAVCPVDEYHLFHKLAQVEEWIEKPPSGTHTLSRWCYLWESILVLSVLEQPAYAHVVLDQFIRVRDILTHRLEGQNQTDYRFRDVELQLERRLKAIAEKWLSSREQRGFSTTEQIGELRLSLHNARLGQTLKAALAQISIRD